MALVVIARALGPGGRGTIAFIAVTAILSARVTRLGVSDAAVVFAAQRPHLRPSLLTNLVLSVTVAAVVAAAAVAAVLLAAPSWRPSGIGDVEIAILALGILASALVDAGYSSSSAAAARLHALITVTTAWPTRSPSRLSGGRGSRHRQRHADLGRGQGVKALMLLWASARAGGFGRPDRACFASRSARHPHIGAEPLGCAERSGRSDPARLHRDRGTLGGPASPSTPGRPCSLPPGAAATTCCPSHHSPDRTLQWSRC